MEFRDLKKQYQVLKPEIDKAIEDVLLSAHFISGPQVRELENALAAYVGVRNCITCANGTDALTLALMAMGIGAGDAVFVPDFTFFATAETVAEIGAEPIFVDVKEDSFNMDPAALEKAILKTLQRKDVRPKAVIAVDLFGLPAEFPVISEIAKKYDLLVIEDGAQGFGGAIDGKRACGFGDISTTSFFPAKPLGCYGDGGAVFTDNDEWASLIRSYAVHGKGVDKYDNVRIGMNSRLDTVQAAILQIKLDAFAKTEVAAVNEVAQWYNEFLSDDFKKPQIAKGYYSSWAQYTLRLESEAQRNELQAALKEAGIPSMVYYRTPMHEAGAFAHLDYDGSCPVTEQLCKTVLSLPMHPYMPVEDVKTVCNILNNLHKKES